MGSEKAESGGSGTSFIPTLVSCAFISSSWLVIYWSINDGGESKVASMPFCTG